MTGPYHNAHEASTAGAESRCVGMTTTSSVITAEALRQARHHAWLARVHTVGAWLLPLVGAATAHSVTDRPVCAAALGRAGGPIAIVLMCASCTASCVLARTAGGHETTRATFRAIATDDNADLGTAVHDLNRAYAMSDRNDTAPSVVTVRTLRPVQSPHLDTRDMQELQV